MSLEILPNGHGEEPPTDERPFSEIIQALLAGSVRATDVARLSDLSRADARTLASSWPELPEEQRTALVRQMDELTEERVDLHFARALRPALDDDSATVRQFAITALWEDSSSDLLERLLRLLTGDPSADVRSEAAKSLGRFVEQAATGDLDEQTGALLRTRLLAAATDDELSPVIQRRALESLGAFASDQQIRDVIEDAYGSEDQSMQASALFAMGRSRDPYWLDLLLGELVSAEAELRFEAARACGELGNEDAVPELMELCADEDTEVRLAAIDALGQVGGRTAIRALQHLATTAQEAENEADLEAIEAALNLAELTDDAAGFGS